MPIGQRKATKVWGRDGGKNTCQLGEVTEPNAGKKEEEGGEKEENAFYSQQRAFYAHLNRTTKKQSENPIGAGHLHF